MTQVIELPSYTDINIVKKHSDLINKYYGENIIDNLRKLYLEDQEEFNLFLKELYIRGFSFNEKWQNNLFHKIDYQHYPFIYVDNDKKRFESLSLKMFSLSNIVSEFNINSDLFFNFIPLEGFYRYIPKEKREYFKNELLTKGFKLIYNPSEIKSDQILIYINGVQKDIEELIPGKEFTHFKEFCKIQSKKNYSSFNLLLEDYKKSKSVRVKTLNDLYDFCERKYLIESEESIDFNIYNNQLREILEENDISYLDFINTYFSKENLEKEQPYLYGTNFIKQLEKENAVNLSGFYVRLNKLLTKLKNHTNYKFICEFKISDFVRITNISNIFINDCRLIYELGHELHDYILINEILIYLDNVPEVPEIVSILYKNLNERELIVLKERNQGKTLSDIGKITNVTRERVRQVEVKAKRKLHLNSVTTFMNNLLLLLFTNNEIVHLNEIKNILNDEEHFYLIRIIIEEGGKFIILDELNTVILKKDYTKFRSFIVDNLSQDKLVIDINEVPFNNENNLEIIKFIANEFNYDFIENKFVQKNISIVKAIEYVFCKHQDEIIINNETGFKRLKELIKSMLGKEISSNQRSLFARVSDAENVILIDRNAYKYEDFSEVDREFISKIKEFIDDGLSKYPYVDPRNIFNSNPLLMKTNDVYSFTHLYSIIKNFYEDEYKIGFQNTLYIYIKDAISYSSEEILLKYIKNNNPVNIETVLKDLRWKQYKLEQIIPRLNNVLLNEYDDVVLIEGLEKEENYDALINTIIRNFEKEYIYTLDMYLDVSLDERFKTLLQKYHIDNLYGFSQLIKTKIPGIRGQKQFLYKKNSEIKNIEDVLIDELPELFTSKELADFLVYKGYSRQKYNISKDKLLDEFKIAPYDNGLFLNLKNIEISNQIVIDIKSYVDKILQSKVYITKYDLMEIDLQFNNTYELTTDLIAYILEKNGYDLIEAYHGSRYELPLISRHFKNYEDLIYYELENNYTGAYESFELLKFLKSKNIVNIKANKLYYSIFNCQRLKFDEIGYFTFNKGVN